SVNVEKVTDADGNISYIFKDGDNNEITTIEVTNDVLTNIVNEGDIYDEIINLIDLNETITTIVDNGDGTITYTNEAGAIVIIDLAAGPKGEDGKSAFDIWEQLPGNDGKSEQDFIDSLKGEDGQDGLDGKSITDVETADYTDPVTGAEGHEITFKDEDGNDVGSVIVYHGVDGEDGQDGATPEIIDGNWWIDGQDTGVAAEGKDGKSIT